MSTKLSKTQATALRFLAAAKQSGKRATASNMKVSLSTLYALSGRGLATYTNGVGSFTYPRISVFWSITEAGEAALEQHDRTEQSVANATP